MEEVAVAKMLWAIVLAYMATYGLGAPVCRLAGLRQLGGLARIGVCCGVGTVIIAWIGYGCAVNAWPLAGKVVVWAAALVGAVTMAFRFRRNSADSEEVLPRRVILILLLAIVVALGYRAAIYSGQVRVTEEGLSGRGLWPDLLYRNAIVKEFMTCDEPPEWPWLAGIPLKGTSVLRLSATATLLSAAGISSRQYQHASEWLGLFGIPVAAGALFALFLAAGASPLIAALAVLISAFFGNPRWLMEERFAHSPVLIWAGGDAFAIVFPVLYAALAVVVSVAREWAWPAAVVAVFMLASVTAFGPWFALPLVLGIFLWLLYTLTSHRGRKPALVLSIGALLGVLTLKFLCGTGAAGGAGLAAVIGPSPVIRSLAWAFPFLDEPLTPLMAELSPSAVAKLVKFTISYGCAAVFFVLGSLWTRGIFIVGWRRWEWYKLRRPAYSLLAAVVIAGLALTVLCDFRKAAYSYADYDMLRLLWVPLLLGNLALAHYACVNAAALRRWYGVVLAVIVVALGAWEYSYYVLEKRLIEPAHIIPAADLELISYLNDHAATGDRVLINPFLEPDTPAMVSHNWGYFSGLCVPAIWLDNRDMAYKFAQHNEWDRRAGLLKDLMGAKEPAALRQFLATERVGWVCLQSDDSFATEMEQAGLEMVFSNSTGRIYRIAPATTQP
jgi:hypothetical protein